MNSGWNMTPKCALVKSIYFYLYLSALNRHHSYRQVRFAPEGVTGCLATLAPSGSSPAVILAKTQTEKCDEEMKQTRLFRTNYWARLCCAANHLTYTNYKEKWIIMRLKNFIRAHCADIKWLTPEHKLSARLWSRQCTINKDIVYQKKKRKMSRQKFESYSVMAVRHKIKHLHNVRPWLSFTLYMIDQSQRTVPSDQSQQWKAGLRETDSSNCFAWFVRNHLEMR